MTRRSKPCVVGNYKFTGKVLGKGNFARVEEASHELLGVKVAVKIMDLNNIKEEYVIRNLLREAKIMSKLKHPCVVSLFETIQKSDNIYYLVTEIVNGGDLCTYVRAQRTGRLDERSTKIFAQQFVSALSYMHQKGIVHRDLKMENVMLNSMQTQIKIVDFGLSNEWTAESPLKTHCGSPEYAAPELFITSRVYGPEVDLWSLGIILYGMTVGELPFISVKTGNITSQEQRKLLVAKINKGIAGPQRKALSSFSYEFRNLMNRLLNADSKKRITIKEMTTHPWISENGRRIVRVNPTRKITAVDHDKIIADIGAYFNLQPVETAKKIKEEPFGKAGGMYNILIYKNRNKTFTPDLIMRSSSETNRKGEITQRLVRTAEGEETGRKNRTELRPHTSSEGDNELNKTKILLTRTPQLTQKHSTTFKESKPKLTVCSVRTQRQRKSNEKPQALSAFHKRQEYAAGITTRFSHQTTLKNPKQSEKDVIQTPIIKKQQEYLEKLTTSKPNKQIRKSSDTNIQKTQPNVSKKRPSTEQSTKSPTASNKLEKNSKLASLQAFMQLIDLQGDAPIRKTGNPRWKSEKTCVSRHSDRPIEPRKSPGILELSSSNRPMSCHSKIEHDQTPLSRHTK